MGQRPPQIPLAFQPFGLLGQGPLPEAHQVPPFGLEPVGKVGTVVVVVTLKQLPL